MECGGLGSPAQGRGPCQSEPGVNVKASWTRTARADEEIIELPVSIADAPGEVVVALHFFHY